MIIPQWFYMKKGHMLKWLCIEKIVMEMIVHNKWLSPKWFYIEKGHMVKWLYIEKDCHGNDCA